MSRYKQAITGDIELDAIGDVTPVAYVTIEDKFDCLNLIKDNFQKKEDALPKIRKFLNKILQEGCFNHDASGRRTGIKLSEAGSETTLVKDIDDFVVTNLSVLFLNLSIKLGFMSKKEVEDAQSNVVKELTAEQLKN